MVRVLKNLLIFSCLVLAVSCSPERKLAKKYLKEHSPGGIMLISPDYVYKNSFKIPNIENFDALPQFQKDSISYYSSEVLKYTDDSVYIKRFMESMNKGLTYFGFSVFYNQPVDQFFTTEEESYIINLVQMQLEEYYDSISDESSYDYEDQNYNSLYITAINLNNWVELTRVNHIKTEPQLLFNSQTITDDFIGNFRYFPETGQFDFEYEIDSLNEKKVYLAASELGYKYSQWIFDYIMNDYVRKNLPQGYVQETLLTYDFRNKLLKRLKWKPFEEIE